jgi:hypothetical protein
MRRARLRSVIMSRFHPAQLVPKLAVAQTLTRPAVLEVAYRIADAAEARPTPGTIYTGAAGVAYALQRCGHRLQDPSLVTTGTQLIDIAYTGVLYAQRYVPEALLDGESMLLPYRWQSAEGRVR